MDDSSSVEAIRRVCSRYRGLYAPSVTAEAAALLDDLADTTAKYGLDRGEVVSTLSGFAADVISSKYGRPAVERAFSEVGQLVRALSDAFVATGLKLAVARTRSGAAVEPVEGGPSWGVGGHAGLAVSLYLNSGWDLHANVAESTRAVPIYAPATPDGAREVAELVRQVIHGETADPFRTR